MKRSLYSFLKWTERYTNVDMIYLVSGNFWLTLGRGVSIITGFALTVSFANLLPPETFGVYKYVLVLFGIATAFSLNGLSAATLRSIGKGYQNVVPDIFRLGILWSIPASGAAFLGGIYYFFMGNVILGSSLFIIALVNPLLANLSITKVLFVATGKFKRATFYNIIRSIVQVGALIGVLLLTDNIIVIVLTYFIVNTVTGYVTYRLSVWELNIKREKTYVLETMRYGKHMSLLGGLQLIIGQLDSLLMWHFAGPIALATYAIALGPVKELRSLSENVTSLAFPKISSRNTKDAVYTVGKRIRQLFLAYLIIALVYVLVAPFIFDIFFPKYTDAIFPSQLLAFLILLQPRALADTFLSAHGEIKDRYIITLPSQIIKAVLLVGLIPPFGLMGAVSAVLLAEVIHTLLLWYAYRPYKK